jgi:hypothetical protein
MNEERILSFDFGVSEFGVLDVTLKAGNSWKVRASACETLALKEIDTIHHWVSAYHARSDGKFVIVFFERTIYSFVTKANIS